MSSPTADDKSGDLGIGKSPVKKWVQFEEDEKQKNDSENSLSPTKSIGKCSEPLKIIFILPFLFISTI